MPKIDLLTINGEKEEKIDLPKEVFAAKVNPVLMAQAVRVYLANQRKASAKTKTRAEVNRTKAKWYRQKGTGRARHGSRSAPIFVGGGVAHGPTGKENYKLKITKKMKRAALFSALSAKFKEGNILVVKGLEKIEPKTKKMMNILKNLKIEDLKAKIMLVLPKLEENILRAGRNIKNISLTPVDNLNTYEVLKQGKIVFTPESIARLKEVFLKKTK